MNQNILLIRLKSMGDVVFTLPAVNVVRDHYPAAKITFLTSLENAALLRGFSAVDEILPLDRGCFQSGKPAQIARESFTLLRRLRRNPFSLVFDFQGYGETELLSWWSGAPERWGIVYSASNRGWAYTGNSIRDPALHPAAWNLALLRAAGLTPGRIRNEHFIPEGDAALAAEFFRGHGLDLRRPTLFVQPFTSSPGKNWPLANFLAVAARARSGGWQVIFGGGPAERAALEPARAAGFVVAAGTPLPVSAGLVKWSSVVLGGDTGLLHLAVAMQKRVVMLLHHAPPACTDPFQHPEWAVTPAAGKSLAELETDQVMEAVTQAFAEVPLTA